MSAPKKPAPVTPVLTKRWLSPRSWSLKTYEQLEGYTAIRKALRGTPEQLVELVAGAAAPGSRRASSGRSCRPTRTSRTTW
jgi:NADH-quinone oxidoreductase subunit F